MTTHLNTSVGEANAKLRELSHRVQEGTAGTVILVREWMEIAADYADTIYDLYTGQVVDPQADGQTYTGTWKVLENKIEGDDSRAVTIVQTLALADASGVTATYMENCDTQVVVTRYFDQTKAQYDAVVTANASSVTGTTVDISAPATNSRGAFDFVVTQRKKQTRQYGMIRVAEAGLERSTRSIEIGLSSGFGAYATAAAIQGGVYRNDVRINPDCTRDAEATYTGSVADTVEIRNLSTAFRAGTEIVYKNSRTAPTAPATVAGSGIYRVSVSENVDQTYDGALTYEYGTNNGVYDFDSTGSQFRGEHTWLYKELNYGVAAPPATGSGIYRADNTLNDNGTYSGRLIYEYGTDNGAYDFNSVASRFRAGHTWIYKELSYGVSTPPATGSGIYRADNTLNDNGTYSGQLTYEYGTDNGVYDFDSVGSQFRGEHTWIYKELGYGIVAPSASGGGVYRATNTLNDNGTYSGQLTYEYGTDNGAYDFDSLGSRFRGEHTWLYKELGYGIVAPSASGGGVYRASNTLNDNGTYSGQLTYEYGTDAGAYDFDSTSSQFRAGHTWVYKELTYGIAAPPAVGTGIYRADNTLNDNGTYSGVLTYEYGTDAGAYDFDSEKSKFRGEHTWIYRDLNYAVAVPSATVGVGGVYRAANTLNNNGTYDGQLTYSYGTNGGVYDFDSEKSHFRQGHTWLYKELTYAVAVPAAAVDGSGVYRADNVLNDNGTYSGRLTYDVGTSDGIYDFDSQSSLSRGAHTWVYKSLNYAVSTPAATGSGIYRADNTINEDGTYDGRLVYEYGTGAGFYGFDSVKTQFRGGHTWLYRELPYAIAVPASVGGTGVYRADNAINENGTYSGQLTYEYGTNSGLYAFDSLYSPFVSERQMLYKDLEYGIAAPTAGVGGIYRAANTLGDDGLYSGDLTYTYSRPDAFTFVSRAAGDTVTTESWLYRNSATAIPADTSAAGYEYSLTQSRNSDGSYDATRYAHIFRPVDTGWFCDEHSITGDASYARVFRNYSTIPTWRDVGRTYGKVDYTINAAGLYDGKAEYEIDDVDFDSANPWWGASSGLIDYEVEKVWVQTPAVFPPGQTLYWRNNTILFDVQHTFSSIVAHALADKGLTGTSITRHTTPNGRLIFEVRRVTAIYWGDTWYDENTPVQAP